MARLLNQRGFFKVAVIRGGLDAWRSHGLPLEPKERKPAPPI